MKNCLGVTPYSEIFVKVYSEVKDIYQIKMGIIVLWSMCVRAGKIKEFSIQYISSHSVLASVNGNKIRLISC